LFLLFGVSSVSGRRSNNSTRELLDEDFLLVSLVEKAVAACQKTRLS